MYFSKVSVIGLGSCRRVYPNTHCLDICKSKGLQWVLSDATLAWDASTVGMTRLRKGILRFTRIQWPIRIDGVSVDAR